MNNRRYKKLGLTWYNKDNVLLWNEEKKEYFWVTPNDIRVSEPRILIEKKTIGKPNSLYKKVIIHDKGKLIPEEKEQWWWVEVRDLPKEEQNLLIRGDNLLALKALEQDFTRQIKLIYIDPPFNTGNAFEHYDDGLEHSIWLSMMKSRLEILYKLLRDDGVIFVHIDDEEMAYLKVLMDEIFGRNNFITSVTLKMSHLSGVKMSHVTKKPPKIKEFLLLYAKQKKNVNFTPICETASWWDAFERYTSYLIRDERDPENIEKWKVKPLRKVAEENGIDTSNDGQFEHFCIKHAHDIFRPARNRSKLFTQLPRDDKFRWVTTPSGIKKLAYKREEVIFTIDKLKNGKPVTVLGDIWLNIGINNLHNEGGVSFRFGKKPERLLFYIIKLCTQPNEWVLDSFLGSGTTAAVAHKMGRKWIGIELFEKTMIEKALPRLKRVVDGKDKSGISKEVGWKAGGGFRYCVLGESLFKVDKKTKVIELTYDNGPMIEAVCKIEGFKFVGMEFVNKTKLHGVVNGIRFCHVTEELVTQDYVDELSSEIKENESLVIYCLSYQSKLKLLSNIEIKKIPRDVARKFRLNSNGGKGSGPNSR